MSSIDGLVKIPELRKRIFYTLLLLAVYRICTHIPVPGINPDGLSQFYSMMKSTFFGYFNLFSGDALRKFSIVALGVMPYISSSIIFQLLTVMYEPLHKLSKEGGELGRRKINQYTRYGTILICVIQALGFSWVLEQGAGNISNIVINPGWAFRITTVITMTAGTTFLMWIGEQIKEKGIGNGISLIIYAGIASQLPAWVGNSLNLLFIGEYQWFLFLISILVVVALFTFIVFMETSQRRIPVQYAKRIVGRKMYGGASSMLPLKLNVSGVIPVIFAAAVLSFPITIANYISWAPIREIGEMLMRGGLLYQTLSTGLIVFFCFFYTAIQFNPQDIADNIKKSGGYIPGIRPGVNTSTYIDKVLTRITVLGAIYLAFVCAFPSFFNSYFKLGLPFLGTGMLILIGVAMDTAQSLETYLKGHYYDTFIQNARMRGRRG